MHKYEWCIITNGAVGCTNANGAVGVWWAQWALEVGAVGARSSGEACAARECGDHGALEMGTQVGAVSARWAQWALEVLERRELHGSAAITELWR